MLANNDFLEHFPKKPRLQRFRGGILQNRRIDKPILCTILKSLFLARE